MENLEHYIDYVAMIIEIVGVAIIAGGILYVLIQYLIHTAAGKADTIERLRHELGKAILLGLEILVAGDIIATVSTEPTMNSVLVLGLIVLIRTFLSFSLQMELEGRWPWQKKPGSNN